MTPSNHSTNQGSAELFAEAAERVQRGEPLESVLASYPNEYHPNLRQLLSIVTVAVQIRDAEIPTPSISRRTANKEAFLRAAAARRSEQSRMAAARPDLARTPAAMPFMERLRALWQNLDNLFTIRAMRLAPMMVMILLVLFGSTTAATLAQSALPGDLTYPFKQWIRHQQLVLTPLKQRPELRSKFEEEIREEVKAAEKRSDLRQAVIVVKETLLFHSEGQNHYTIGGLQVLPRYQADPNVLNYTPMQLQGNPQPGQQVTLEYQILPGQQSADVPVVQGIALSVLEDQPLEPTPIPTATTVPTVTPTRGAPLTCTPDITSGWMPYAVKEGDTIAGLASRSGVSESDLRRVNCLSTDSLFGGGILLLPALNPTGAATPPTPIPTVTPTTVTTATNEALLTPTVAVTATADAPAATPALTTTAVMTGALTPVSTPAITATTVLTAPATPDAPDATEAYTQTLTPPATLETTPEAPAATTEFTPTITPQATPAPAGTETETPPGEATNPPTPVSTAEATDEPTPETPAGATPEDGTATPTPTETPTPTPHATATAGEGSAATESPTPVATTAPPATTPPPPTEAPPATDPPPTNPPPTEAPTPPPTDPPPTALPPSPAEPPPSAPPASG